VRRKGIALLITIAFVTAIAALIAVAGGVLNKGFAHASEKAFAVQSNVLLSDIYTLLRQNSKDINTSDGLDIFLSVPLFFENKERGIMADISFNSDAARVNVNKLLADRNTSRAANPDEPLRYRTAYEEYFERILTVYNVSDTILLISMIADTIDDDLTERAPGSEIALQDPDFTQGHIFNMRHFRQILDAYKKATLDYSVDDIPWDTLIGFRNDSVDFNHISPDVLRFMDPTIDEGTVAELTTERIDLFSAFTQMPLTPESSKLLQDMNVTFYSPLVVGKMNIIGDKHKVTYTFAYDLSTQKVSDFAVAD